MAADTSRPVPVQRLRTRGWRLSATARLVDRACADLRGYDLACTCGLPEPGQPDLCHRSVWLRHVNPPLTCEAAHA